MQIGFLYNEMRCVFIYYILYKYGCPFDFYADQKPLILVILEANQIS